MSRPIASRTVLREASWATASSGSVGSWLPGRRIPVVICSRRSPAICLYLASATGPPSRSDRNIAHIGNVCQPGHWYDLSHQDDLAYRSEGTGGTDTQIREGPAAGECLGEGPS